MTIQYDPPGITPAGKATGQPWIIGNHRTYADKNGIHLIAQLVDVPSGSHIRDPPGIAGRGGNASIQRGG
jgi:hypothetical protein